MAAGATVGSNHNSRANDGELRAGRGFWPGLSVTLKHSSRFASFCLIVKGDYPYELNIPLPFSLINNNVRRDKLEVMPAYFWMYNLYALERNSWKTINRDKRLKKVQHIESDYLAPDTAEEIIKALELMEGWLIDYEKKVYETTSDNGDAGEDPEYDYSPEVEDEALPVDGLERHNRRTLILKPRKAAAAYREMLFFYGMKTLIAYLEKQAAASEKAKIDKTMFEKLTAEFSTAQFAGTDKITLSPFRVKDWVNLGGQIVPAFRLDALRKDIGEGKIKTWEDIHARYDAIAAAYDNDRACHAWAVLAYGYQSTEAAHPFAKATAFKAALERTVRISEWIKEQVRLSRAKDFHDPFRSITYRNKAEMEQVAGKLEDNPFIRLVEENHRRFAERVEAIKARL